MTEDAMRAMHQQFTATLVRGSQVTGGRSGHATAVEAKRLLRGARRVVRLEHSVQWVRWCSDTTSVEADG